MTVRMQATKATGTPASRRWDRRRMARLCGNACVALMLLLAVAAVYSQTGMGCYLGVALLMASLAILGGPALVLLLVTAWLRLSELIWVLAIGILIAFAAGVALQLLPIVHCGYPG